MNHRRIFSEERKAHDLAQAQNLVGKKLAALSNVQYYFESEKVTDDIGDIEWQCTDGSTVAMFLLTNGESVGADTLPADIPQAFELEEGERCSWQTVDLLSSLAANYLVGKKIVSVQAFVDYHINYNYQILSGFKVLFESGDFIFYYNCGDDGFALLNQLPSPNEGIKSELLESLQ
ncbi:hypothetical protein MST27_19965 [Pseudomonas sp. PS1]|uniref:Uncharacterized protein n=1 Tax=Stutzerimonas marianensis TaxID=2929513 RepID=A0A9X2AU05_9GAMM|nr:hypothetical protein [Pseudomonas marianensis]MCJ0975649.1 hypothetical protein [Pseudomonas marianensis]